MACDDTLRVKNFPKELSDTEQEEFLRHFGAIQVKILTSNYKQKSIAYAKFSSKEIAKSVMLRLHQMSVLNCRLSIEFAKYDLTENEMQPIKKLEKTDNHKNFKSFLNKLNAWNSAVSFNQPPPPHLKYVYPKSNRATINNIAHALASVPKFYTQVLHLMNKMNLPPPFSNVPDRVHSHHHIMTQHLKSQVPLPEQGSSKTKEDSSESELESDPDSKELKEIIPKKRSLSQKKMVKRPKFIKPPVIQQATKILERNDIFEKVDMQPQRKIEVKLSADSLEPKVSQSTENVGSFGIINEAPKEKINTEIQETVTETVSDGSIITDEELVANRIPVKDLSVLPVFKNYHAGAPSCRLYIKNIAKTVETRELESIYKRYADDSNEDQKPSQFDIRLMQEGKMKGQAFVTFNSIQLAQKALKETNGYILKDKPLVVVFARSAIPKK